MITNTRKHTFQNGVTGTGNGAEFDVHRGDGNIRIDVAGANGTTATVVFEGQCIKDGAWRPLGAVLSDYSAVASTTSTINSLWSVSLDAITKLRVRVSAISGTLTVKGVVIN